MHQDIYKLHMSKHKQNIRYIIHYVKPTAQLLFKIRFPKGGPTWHKMKYSTFKLLRSYIVGKDKL